MGLVAGMAVGGVTKLLGGAANKKAERAAAAAREEQRRLQKIEIVKSMNWQDASLRLDMRNLLESTIDELTEVNFAAIRNSSAVAAGISESGMEGRTVARAQRKVDQVALRQASRLNENYQRDYASILGQRESAWQQGQAQITGLGSEVTAPKTSGLGMFFDVATGVVQGGMQGHELEGRLK